MFEDQNSVLGRAVFEEKPLPISDRDAKLEQLNTQLEQLNTQMTEITNRVSDIEGYIGYTEDDIYGVEVDYENRTFVRLAGAVGKTPGADFDSAFGGRRRCNLADDGTVNAYFGDAGYKEDGSNGQVMVEQPKFYYKVVPLKLDRVTNGKGFHLRKARYYVSITKKAGFKVHPAFVKNGVEKEKIYLSAFEGSLYDVSASAYILDDAQIADFTAGTGDKLSSIANAKPISGSSQNLTRRNCGILAENRGTGWSQAYAATIACSQLLFTIEYASMNTQSKIGAGVTSKTDDGATNMSELTGATTNLGNASGSVTNTNGYNVVSYRGEENLWGNIWKFTDGMNIYCDASQGIHSLYIADNAFAESKNTDNYKDAGITLATKDGYVSAMAYNEEFDWLFVPAETLGDSALPVGDSFYQNVSFFTGYRVALLGGHWAYGSPAGAFFWNVYIDPSNRGRIIGGRLVYVP